MLTPFESALRDYGEALVAYHAAPAEVRARDRAWALVARAQETLNALAREEAEIREQGDEG